MTEKKKSSSKEKIRQFLLANIGRVIKSHELQAAADGAVQYSRRLRELREQEGWKILTHNDSLELKPGEYLLTEAPSGTLDLAFVRGLSSKLRAEVLDRNGFTCQMCGLTPGDIDPGTRRKVRLHIGHIKDKSLGGKDELSNLRSLCSTCNQGAKNITAEKPTAIWLLSQIRRAGQDEQRAVYNWLRGRFGG
ncbi:HNH endonuclease [Candidatus Methylobacter favarea]|uniref:HNH endonuclease n=1 Tax=Candidatus Methylobacter favarea TaxID=2707345 RepID=A0A8S0Y6T4_9GAMM|nr:HNH endonuclease [Candidatus Methylobacter favarea]CAA9892139.1 HNH endonuclease [Candidatus Methylobacter favarea]